MNLNPLHLVSLDGLLKDGVIAPSLSFTWQFQDIGKTGKEIQRG
jgi:hypothetical protein